MNEIVLGGNGFRHCRTLISLGGKQLLGVSPGREVIELWVPGRESSADEPVLALDSCTITGPAGLKARLHVVENGRDVRLFLQHALVLVVSHLSGDITHVHLDLRPLGIRVFSDSEGLHVGPHSFFNLAFQNQSPAITVATASEVRSSP